MIRHAKYKKQYFEPKKIHKISLTSIGFNDNISYGTKLNREKLSLIQSGGGKRIYEATATPESEGANLSEQSNNKRIDLCIYKQSA